MLSTKEESESTKHTNNKLIGILNGTYEAARLDILVANTDNLNAI